MELNIYSENANGMGCEIKRQSIFDKVKRKGEGIFLFQETHSTIETEDKFKTQFDSKNLFFSHGTSNSRGVLTAITKNYDVEILKVDIDDEGRYLVIDIKRNGFIYRIGNIYAPCRNFENAQIRVLGNFVRNIFHSPPSENIITSGDWNLYLTNLDKLDSMSEANDNGTYRQHLKSFLEANNMVDAWRSQNQGVKMFTWHRGHKRARLDYIFCSEHLLNNMSKVEILPGIQSDHSLLHFQINSNKTLTRGKGFWKWNCNLIHDIEYVNHVKTLIQTKSIEHDIEDLGLKWDLIKLDIRNFTIPYCSRKKKANTERENKLNDRYLELFNEVHSQENVEEVVLNEFNNVKNELESIEKNRSRGIILRSKIQWAEEGEKNTSFFLRLEKSNYCNKHIEQLIDPATKQIVNTPEEVLQLEQSFYKNLYDNGHENRTESLEGERTIFENIILPQLSENQKNDCERPLGETELAKAIKAMKNVKSPGCDGFTAEFYKFFYVDIKNLLLNGLNFDLQHGKLSLEKRRGILTLIPKKDKNRLFLKNWRPLTLLNVDYKILAKAMANRMIEYLPDLIKEDQTGYLPGRFIGCNIRLVEDIIIFTENEKIKGIMLVIDFEKAFDTLKWSFIQKTLEAFNFGVNFRSYIKTLYTDIETTVINNGFTSGWFKPKRGVRQGCPLSPYLFLLAVEILACNIRQNRDIKGIIIGNRETKITQLADDTTCFLKDEPSLSLLLKTFDSYKLCAGLSINVDKTIARPLGGLKPSREKLFDLDWSDGPVNILGAVISGDEKDHYNLNFKPKLIKMKQLLDSWKCRKLSLKGKITVINTLAISKLIFLCAIIAVPQRVYSEAKEIIRNFLWDGGSPKIAYDTLTRPIQEGGLKLIDLEAKVKSLNISWIKRLSNNSDCSWKLFPKVFFHTDDLNFFFSCNRAPIATTSTPVFYKAIQHAWANLLQVKSPTQAIILNQTLWNNRYITINNSPYCWKTWKAAGIKKVNDIFVDNSFLTPEGIYHKYGVRVNFLEVLQIRQSLPFTWRNILNICPVDIDIEIAQNVCFHNGKNIQLLSKSKAKQIYSIFNQKPENLPRGPEKWNMIFPEINYSEWKTIFQRSFVVTRETRLHSFQYKIIHQIIMCQKKLFQITISDSPNCVVCDQIDDLTHFLIQCRYVQIFWTELFNWLIAHDCIEINDALNHKEILFGITIQNNNTFVINYIILYAKFYIYNNRINNNHTLSLNAFKSILKYNLSIEKAVQEKSKGNGFLKFQLFYQSLI